MAPVKSSTKSPGEPPTSDSAAAPLPPAERVRSPRVQATPCPRNPAHTDTQVYKTKGQTRHCKCNQCGETWKLTGAFADPLKEFCRQLAESLDAAERVDDSGEPVVIFGDATAREIAADLRDLLKS